MAATMPEGRRTRWGRRRPLVTPETFVEYLMHEIERYDRYQRRFSLLLAKAPTEGDELDRVMALRRAADAVDRSIRACDLAALFQRYGLIATLLPEVGLDGARVVHDRFISIIGGPETGWTFKMAAYPEHAEIIDAFAERADTLVESEPPTMLSSVEHPAWQMPASALQSTPPAGGNGDEVQP